MLGRDKDPHERQELEDYKKLHGACKGYSPIAVEGPRVARFKMECERGRLEMNIRLGNDDRIVGFAGTSRDLPIEPELRKLAGRVVGLVGKWDDATYKSHLAAKSKRTREQIVNEFDALRAMHGACTIESATRLWLGAAYGRKLELACERGGNLSLLLEIGPDRNLVERYAFERMGGTCPNR
jgi:hypothetical protein